MAAVAHGATAGRPLTKDRADLALYTEVSRLLLWASASRTRPHERATGAE